MASASPPNKPVGCSRCGRDDQRQSTGVVGREGERAETASPGRTWHSGERSLHPEYLRDSALPVRALDVRRTSRVGRRRCRKRGQAWRHRQQQPPSASVWSALLVHGLEPSRLPSRHRRITASTRRRTTGEGRVGTWPDAHVGAPPAKTETRSKPARAEAERAIGMPDRDAYSRSLGRRRRTRHRPRKPVPRTADSEVMAFPWACGQESAQSTACTLLGLRVRCRIVLKAPFAV